MDWLPEPPPGTAVCLSFDGSDTSDWSSIAGETRDGYSFTPRRSATDPRPAIWRPEQELGGRVPRVEVRSVFRSLYGRFRVVRTYADPWRWETDVEAMALEFGDSFASWPTNKPMRMHAALERFLVDLGEGRITQDGCPLTALAMDHARMVNAGAERYILGKPSEHQKIDPGMTRVLAHEAACDATAGEDWDAQSELPPLAFGM